ncbi:uncharacterized protein LOC115673505 [Syzygium oleosum]|uniref:uncharacterized protein LOC115673505 n=1 Tax=Syzygium oleosum TaxID=219896 RepID=UPI0024BAA911|nr:uncharacterized protein LOC115673505 [Syzygium oleosum]
MEDIVINELPLLKLAIAYFTIVEIGELARPRDRERERAGGKRRSKGGNAKTITNIFLEPKAAVGRRPSLPPEDRRPPSASAAPPAARRGALRLRPLARARGGAQAGAVPLSSDQFAAARALLPPLTLSSARMFELDAPRERAGARNPRWPLPVRSAGRPSRPVFSRGCIVWALGGGGGGGERVEERRVPLRSRGGGGAIGDWKKCGVVSSSRGLQVVVSS